MPKPQHIYRANQVSAEKDLLTVEGSEKVVQYFRQPVRLITMTSLCLATTYDRVFEPCAYLFHSSRLLRTFYFVSSV